MGGGRFQGTGQGRTIGVCIADLADREGVCKKALKGKDAVTIANELEEDDVGKVQRIMDVAKSFAPDYDVEEIYKKLME